MMLTLSISLHLLIVLMCAGGCIWEEYKDNAGERVGMAVIGIVCLLRAMMAVQDQIAEKTDVALAAALIIFGWGMFYAKLKNMRAKVRDARNDVGGSRSTLSVRKSSR